MYSKIHLDAISILNNPSKFTDPINIEVTFTTLESLPHLIDWKVTYVGSAKSQNHDQILEEFQVDSMQDPCTSQFHLPCPPPNPDRIPKDEILCVTALILTASYRDQEFIRVGYYVHNELINPPSTLSPIDNFVPYIRRTIISDRPRITKFNIDWNPKIERQSNLLEYFSKRNPIQEDCDSKNYKDSEKQSTIGDSQSLLMCLRIG